MEGKETRRKAAAIGMVLIMGWGVISAVFLYGHGGKKSELYYRRLEKEYVSSIRELLYRNGYADSGVTLTRIIDGNSRRDYTITIYHKKINSLPEPERQKLEEEISALFGLEVKCSLRPEFLTSDL